MFIKKEFTEAKIEISHKNANMLQMRLKGRLILMDPSRQKLNSLSWVEGFKLDAFADNPFNIVVKSNNFHAMNLTFYFKPSYVGEKYAKTTFGYEAKTNGVSMFKYDISLKTDV